MSTLITILHVIVCLFLMLTVLLQSGKGGGMGAAFGGGNAATVFGASGASGFLKKLTAIAGTIFMITSMVLAFIASHNSADALEKYGEEQQKLADDKEKARDKALQDAKKNQGSGSAVTPGAGSAPPFTITPGPGSAVTPTPGSAGSGVVNPGNPDGGKTGSAPTPAEKPIPAGGSDKKASPNPATPAGAGPATGSNAKPAPAAPPVTKPAPSTTEPPKPQKPNPSEPKGSSAPPNASSPNAPK